MPAHEEGFFSPSQTFFTEGSAYEVHAVSAYEGIAFLPTVDDQHTAKFDPRARFDIVDPSIPSDWICNTFTEGPVQLVMGPPFIAKDLDSYDAMIDMRWEQFLGFWRMVDEREKANKPNSEDDFDAE